MLFEEKIGKYLHEWFIEHDSLLVPDLGKFEAEYMGASIHPAINKMLPPNKLLSFDAAIRENDQIFIKYVAANEGLALEDTARMLKQFVTNLKIELGAQKKFKIKHFGTLVTNPDGSISFIQDEDLSFLGESYGLPNLYVKPMTKSQPLETKATVLQGTSTYELPEVEDEILNKNLNDDLVIEEEVVESSQRRLMWIVAIGLLAISSVFIYFLWTDFSFGGEEEKNKDKMAAEAEKEMVEEDTKKEENSAKEIKENSKKETKKEETYKKDEAKLLPRPEVRNTLVQSFVFNPAPPLNLNQISVRSASSRYFIVLASFDIPENAYSFYNNLNQRGFKGLKIIQKSSSNPRLRVTCGDYQNKEDAERNGIQFSQKNDISFWVYKY